MGSTTSVRSAACPSSDRRPSPSELALRIGVVAAETAFAAFARNIDLAEAEADDDWDFEGSIGPAEWPVFSLVLDTLAAAEPGDARSAEERRADAVKDLARICLAVKDATASAA